jgi:hypothetical protein
MNKLVESRTIQSSLEVLNAIEKMNIMMAKMRIQGKVNKCHIMKSQGVVFVEALVSALN